MSNKMEAIVLDWAGTTVDFGCFAPVEAFMKAFHQASLYPTMEETRAPMGMQKRAHIQTMLAGDRLSAAFRETHGHAPTDGDVDGIYRHFEPALMAVLQNYGELLPDVQETISKIREKGIKIGSTTGYTKPMMDVLTPIAKRNGYEPDCLVCPDETNEIGRPYPYMLWRNLEKLEVMDSRRVVKVGDTAADMAEGKNAGCITVGVIYGSSMLGLSKTELDEMDSKALKKRCDEAKQQFFQAGADHVITEFANLPYLISKIESGE